VGLCACRLKGRSDTMGRSSWGKRGSRMRGWTMRNKNTNKGERRQVNLRTAMVAFCPYKDKKPAFEFDGTRTSTVRGT